MISLWTLNQVKEVYSLSLGLDYLKGVLNWILTVWTYSEGVTERTSTALATGGGGLNAFDWYQIFALDSAVDEVQEMFSSHVGLLINEMYHHGEIF